MGRWTFIVALFGAACAADKAGDPAVPDRFEALRERMVRTQIAARGVKDASVLRAMRSVPRHRFVPADQVDRAYTDRPLAIGHEQTISQPYIVALMTELALPAHDAKVLEIGTGSGYQAAVLAECFGEVYSIEIVGELGRRAATTLAELGYDAVNLRVGDGYAGWAEAAPFDAIVVTAAPSRIPEPLIRQLAPGGRLVIPVGDASQELVVATRTEDGLERRTVIPVRFVPMTGRAREVD